MTLCNRVAALGVAGLSLVFAWAAARLFYGLATGQIQDNLLFGVATCCDIPQSAVVSKALLVAIPLCVASYAGRWLAVGVWGGSRNAGRVALVWLAVFAGSQVTMAQGKVPSVRDEHFQLACVAFFLFVMALPVALAGHVEPTRQPDDAPIASAKG